MRKEKKHGSLLEGLNVSTMTEIQATLYSFLTMMSSLGTFIVYTVYPVFCSIRRDVIHLLKNSVDVKSIFSSMKYE